MLEHVEARLARRAAAGRRASAARRANGRSLLPDPARPIGMDTLPQVRHIVVLMMENHSFDNYLGLLGRGDGLPRDEAGNPTSHNHTSDGRAVAVHRLSATTQQVGVPTQSWEASREQWSGGTNDGFVRSAVRQRTDADASAAMGFWTEQDLPFYHGLARVFPLADRWFSSCLGPTFPNRRFLVAGTAHGLISDRISQTFDRPANGTIFDLLARHRIAWMNYHPVSHIGPMAARLLGIHGLRTSRMAGGFFKERLGGWGVVADDAKSFLQFTGDAYPLGLHGYLRHVRSVEHFIADTHAGRLPPVSIVDPDFHRNSEENPQDIQRGEAFAARIINAAMRGPGWPHTLLIWVYDEHGGYYDHVPPPVAVEPDDRQPKGPWRYDRYGFRVPAVIVSPYARPDYVSHVVHDHTSILKLIETKWNLPPLTRRDAQADNLLDSLDLSAPPAFARPPDLPAPAVSDDGEPR